MTIVVVVAEMFHVNHDEEEKHYFVGVIVVAYHSVVEMPVYLDGVVKNIVVDFDVVVYVNDFGNFHEAVIDLHDEKNVEENENTIDVDVVVIVHVEEIENVHHVVVVYLHTIELEILLNLYHLIFE